MIVAGDTPAPEALSQHMHAHQTDHTTTRKRIAMVVALLAPSVLA
jgi:hypothetical protein